jgi:hypothetical protein
MSDPREFERDPDLSRSRNIGRQSGTGDGSGWIIAGVIVVVLLGVAAYSYHDTQVSSSSAPETTMGQGTRAPAPNSAPNTPSKAPAAPAPKQEQPQP